MASNKVEYNEKMENTLAGEIEAMKRLFDTDYFEIWVGRDGYDIASAQEKIYDSDADDQAKFVEIFGRSMESLDNLIIPRACSSSLSPDSYEERTGCAYPQDKADEHGLSSVILITLGVDGTENRIKCNRFATK